MDYMRNTRNRKWDGVGTVLKGLVNSELLMRVQSCITQWSDASRTVHHSLQCATEGMVPMVLYGIVGEVGRWDSLTLYSKFRCACEHANP